jgi:hypothetical protein
LKHKIIGSLGLSLPQIGIFIIGGTLLRPTRPNDVDSTLPPIVYDPIVNVYYDLTADVTFPVRCYSKDTMLCSMNDGTLILRGPPSVSDPNKPNQKLAFALPSGIARLTALAQIARSRFTTSSTTSSTTKGAGKVETRIIPPTSTSAVLHSTIGSPIVNSDWIEITWPKDWMTTPIVHGVTS